MTKPWLRQTLSLLLAGAVMAPGAFMLRHDYPTESRFSQDTGRPDFLPDNVKNLSPVNGKISGPDRQALLAAIKSELLILRTRFTPQKTRPLPARRLITGLSHCYQTFNNCGPASLSMLLNGFGITASQEKIRERLRPDKDDRHTSMEELAGYVRGLGLYAVEGTGGDTRMVKELAAAGIPVMLKIGLDPETDDWMCHYIVVVGYADDQYRFILMDSLYGPYFPYAYKKTEKFWAHFLWTYLVIAPPEKREQVLGIIAPYQVSSRPGTGLKMRVYDAVLAAPQEPFSWYNLGRLLLDLGRNKEAETAMQTARDLGLPWRLPWYDFSLYEVYLRNSRFDALLAVTGIVLTRNPFSEEARYYRARALLALGKKNSALVELDKALEVNPHFSPAIKLLKEIRKSH